MRRKGTKTFENVGQLNWILCNISMASAIQKSQGSVEEKERSGRPTTKMIENIPQAEQILKKDFRVSCRMIMESTWIRKIIVQRTL